MNTSHVSQVNIKLIKYILLSGSPAKSSEGFIIQNNNTHISTTTFLILLHKVVTSEVMVSSHSIYQAAKHSSNLMVILLPVICEVQILSTVTGIYYNTVTLSHTMPTSTHHSTVDVLAANNIMNQCNDCYLYQWLNWV